MHVYMRANSLHVTCMHINMTSPKPFYYEHIGQEFHLFEGGEPQVFDTFPEMEGYVRHLGFPYELILVDLNNWDALASSGVFDCEG